MDSMFTDQTTYIGIDPSAGKRPLTFAALDRNLNLVAVGKGSLDETLAFIAGQHQAVIAISAPPRPNQGLMSREDIRSRQTPPPRPGRWSDFRLAEYLLRQHRIRCPKTPASEKACPTWIRRGFQLYRRLEDLGCQPYPSEASLQWVEVYPHACYSVLLGRAPFPKTTFEGRIQRQLVLYARDVNVPDAMRVFEEITRHHLLRGVLPIENLYTPTELDALVAAFSAWMADLHPDETLLMGDPAEGQVLLPIRELKSRY